MDRWRDFHSRSKKVNDSLEVCRGTEERDVKNETACPGGR